MGYSCTMRAGNTLDAIQALIGSHLSNGMPDGGFYEVGRENAAGAITGTVYKRVHAIQGTRYATRNAGGFRIEPDGRVSRFPGLPAKLLRQAEKDAEAKLADAGDSGDLDRDGNPIPYPRYP